MTVPRSSVLIASFNRPERLIHCLRSLAVQTVLPDEVLVVWQGTDVPTRDAAGAAGERFPTRLVLLHCAEPGVVAAENLGLAAASGDILLLIDDDAVAPPDWIARHLVHYSDPLVGAVGGSANNFHPDGSTFPQRAVEPIGRLTWYGKVVGNMYDQVAAWRSRPPLLVDHLVGYNLSIRRTAFNRFESGLKRYWQLFELDVCLQARSRGFRILFDFANAVAHHPTNTAYSGGRDGDLTVKVLNAAYNQAFVLARHSPTWLRAPRLIYLLLVGSVATPGVLGCFFAMRRYGNPSREITILGRTWQAVLHGWWAGSKARSTGRKEWLRANRDRGAHPTERRNDRHGWDAQTVNDRPLLRGRPQSSPGA